MAGKCHSGVGLQTDVIKVNTKGIKNNNSFMMLFLPLLTLHLANPSKTIFSAAGDGRDWKISHNMAMTACNSRGIGHESTASVFFCSFKF